MIKAGAGQNTQLYTDLAELQKLKSQSKGSEGESLRLAAEQFEQLFLNMLLRSMRDANEAFGKDNFMNSSQTKFYQGMFDNQIAMEVSSAQGVGLSDVLVRQLSHSAGQEMSGAEELKPLDMKARQMNSAIDQAASIAASALLAKAEGQENPPGITLTDEQKSTVQEVFEKRLNGAESVASNLPERFETPEEFVEKLLPLADKVSGELGVDPRVLLAQAALETGWGKYMVRSTDGMNSNNLFNIKADTRWQGDSAQVSTLEYKDGVAQKERAFFRSYDSYEDSFRDYVDFLKASPRYRLALDSAADPYDYVQQLQEAGYATDPEYAEKIKNIFDGELLASSGVTNKES
jgi:flagellar protein FlgJ